MKSRRTQRGATQTEYLLLTFLIAILLITAVNQFGGQVTSTLQSSSDTIEEEFEA